MQKLSRLTLVDTKQTQGFTNAEKSQARANIGAVGYDDLNRVSPMTSLTYKDLVAARNGDHLVPGMNYRITDYMTTTSQENTTAAGHQFDIIVQALDTHTLSETAKACRHIIQTNIEDMSSIKLKALVIGDDFNGEYAVDEGAGLYVYYDKYEIDGTEYFRWIKYNTIDGWLPVSPQGSYALTINDTFDLSQGYVEFDGFIIVDQSTGAAAGAAYDIGKVIMDVTEIEVPLVVFGNRFDEDYLDSPNVPDGAQYYVYRDRINIDGTDYYKWQKYEFDGCWDDDGIERWYSTVYYMLTTTKTYRNGNRYEPAGVIIDDGGEIIPYEARATCIVETNYESVFYQSGEVDPYFDNCKLEAWELKYCIDNDADRFAWTFGIQFTLEDINGNRVTCSKLSDVPTMTSEYKIGSKIDFMKFVRGTEGVLLAPAKDIADLLMDYQFSSIEDFYNKYNNACLDILLTPTRAALSVGKGVIYYMKDEWNNECPYDFKNIQFYRKWNSSKSLWCDIVSASTIGAVPSYTFSSVAYDGDITEFTDYSLGDNRVCSNIIKEYIKNTVGVEGTPRYLNNICFFGHGCYNNTFEFSCYNNTFGYSCRENTFGYSCHDNTFGANCYNNIFYIGCHDNTSYYDINNNVLSNGCYNNVFNNSSYNFLDINCHDNIFSSCLRNRFGKNCTYITFADRGQYVSLGDGVRYCNIRGTTPPAVAKYIQNVRIAQGLQGTSSSVLDIEVEPNLDCETYVGKNSSGELVIKNLLDN